MRPYRKQKVASFVRDIVAEAIQHRLHDPRLTPLTTITRVEMSSDLQIARVYLSVPGEASKGRLTLTAVRHAGGFLQRLVAGQLTMRQCPELQFELDERSERVQETLRLLDKNRLERGDLDEPDAADREEAQDRLAAPDRDNDGDDGTGEPQTGSEA